jgi:mono/diheme cytochrome c family protein
MKKPELLARILLFALLAAAGFAGALVLAPALGLPVFTSGADYEIHARMPENGGWSPETLYAEAGKPLRLRLTSDDVLHSFAIGQRDTLPIDLKPGEWQDTTLVFDQPGRYVYYCTRWCGRNHWRMRGTIIVTGQSSAAESAAAQQPLYLRLGINVDAPHVAGDLPAVPLSPERGAALMARLPAWALARQTYLENSPSGLWRKLRDDTSLKDLDDAALWDAVAALWARQTTPERLSAAAQRYATNCAACHGETGKGDGVMVEGLPRFDPAQPHAAQTADDPSGMPAQGGQMSGTEMGLSAPPDLTDPRAMLGASPALLEGKMLRGGMGTGMPYWGPIFTQPELDDLIAYLYTFAMKD